MHTKRPGFPRTRLLSAGLLLAALALTACSGADGTGEPPPPDREGQVESADGVSISYSAWGDGGTGLVFIHGSHPSQVSGGSFRGL